MQPSATHQPQPGFFPGNDRARGSQCTEANESLETFVRYFVKEAEAKLYSYHLILEGELKKSGKFSDAFSGIIGQGLGGAMVGAVAVFFGLPAGGSSILAAAGKAAGEKLGSMVGSKAHTKKVVSLSDLINHSQERKSSFRKLLVEAGFDVFQSFEMQFMRVTNDKGQKKDALHKLARDSVNRILNYLKNKNFAFISEGVLLGESKKEAVYSVSPGYQIIYAYKSSKKWNTSSLYSKAGLVVTQKRQQHYFKKKDSTSSTGKYGYRRLFIWEKWDRLREVYEADNIVESESGEFTDYEYFLLPTDMKVKCKDLLKQIDFNDPGLSEERIRDVLEEVKDDIMNEINLLKTCGYGRSEDGEVLSNIEENLRRFDPRNYLQVFKQHFEEAKVERMKMMKSIKGEFQDAIQQRRKIARDNKRDHETTQAGVERLNKEVVNIRQCQEESQEILDELRGGNRRRANERSRTFNMTRKPVNSFIGRQKLLEKIVSDLQTGTVVIAGLSGIGKSELALEVARAEFNEGTNVVWINAHTHETIKRSFHLVYRSLGFRITYADGAEKDIRSIAEVTYDYFFDQKCLFIFDNAERLSAIQYVLPLDFLANVNKPKILITSNNTEVDNSRMIPLNEFSLEESVDFIKKYLDVKDESGGNEMRQLAETLHNFPLALHQAVGYITKVDRSLKNVDPTKKFTVSEYLEKYKEKKEELLKCTEFQKLGSDCDKTTFTAVEINLNKIRNHEHSLEALKILNIMAYFAPEMVPAKAFLALVNDDEEALGSRIQLLKDYSIVRHEGLLNIHGVVQQVIRLELQKHREEDGMTEEEEVLDKILGSLKKYMLDYKTVEDYLPHIVSVWNHASKYDRFIDTFIVSNVSSREVHTTYFHIIVESGPYGVLEHILKSIEGNHPSELSKVIKQETNSNATPLHSAALSGDERKMKLLTSRGAYVNAETKHKWRPLHFAAKTDCLEGADLLLEKGADVNAKTEYGFTALHVAVKGGYLRIVDILLAKGAEVNLKTNRGFTALHFAADTGRTEIVSLLIRKGAGVEDKTRHGYTPLHLAAKHGYGEIFDFLIASGVGTEPRTRYKITPLHYAAGNGHLRIVQTLLSRGSNIDAKNQYHFTPLHLAALNGHLEVVIALIHGKADVNATTTRGNTPLHVAVEKGHFSVVKALITGKAKVDVTNTAGETIQDLAIGGSDSEIRHYIIEHCQNAEDVHAEQQDVAVSI